MADDLYTQWLNIPPGARPPDHYAMLGLPQFSEGREEIEQAASGRMDLLDKYSLNADPAKREACQQMMNEVAQARLVLVDPQRRAEYNLTLPANGPWPVPAADIREVPRASRRLPKKVLVAVAALLGVIVTGGLLRELFHKVDRAKRAPRETSQVQSIAQPDTDALNRVGLLFNLAMRASDIDNVDDAAIAFENACDLARRTHVLLTPEQRKQLATFLIVRRPAGGLKYAWGSGRFDGPVEMRRSFFLDAASQTARMEKRRRCLELAVPVVADPSELSRQLEQERDVSILREKALTAAKIANFAAVNAEQKCLAFQSTPCAASDADLFSSLMPVPDANPMVVRAWNSAVMDFATAGRLFMDNQYFEAAAQWEKCRKHYSLAASIGAEAHVLWSRAGYEWALARPDSEHGALLSKAEVLANKAREMHASAGSDVDALEAAAATYRQAELLLKREANIPAVAKSGDDTVEWTPSPVPQTFELQRGPTTAHAPRVVAAKSVATDEPHRIVFVCNKSTHMNRRLRIVKQLLNNAIDDLTPSQSFNVIWCGENGLEKLTDASFPGTPELKQKARTFLDGIETSENGDVIRGLEFAFKLHPESIVLIADWDFEDDEALLARLRTLNKNKRVRISTLAFFQQRLPVRGFLDIMKQIAQDNEGKFKVIYDF